MVGVITVGPGCVNRVLKSLVTNNHESRVFWYISPPSSLLIIVLQPRRGKTPAFWMFLRDPIVRGNAHTQSKYLLISSSISD